MIGKIFVNLPVKDLDKSMAFFKAIGFSFNPQFTDKTAACMVMSDDIYAMLLTHDKVKQFTRKQIADAHKTTEVLTALPGNRPTRPDTDEHAIETHRCHLLTRRFLCVSQ